MSTNVVIVILLVLNFALLAALGFAVWIIYTDYSKIRAWSDPCEPLEPIDVERVYGEVVEK